VVLETTTELEAAFINRRGDCAIVHAIKHERFLNSYRRAGLLNRRQSGLKYVPITFGSLGISGIPAFALIILAVS
jgi:hypothetical protein